jgi:hypothetical protein
MEFQFGTNWSQFARTTGHSLTVFGHEEITLLRKFACEAGTACRSGSWQRTVASFTAGRPELLQGTVIDITAQKKAQARLRDIKAAESTVRMPAGENARVADLSQQIAEIHGLRDRHHDLVPRSILNGGSRP